MTHVRIKPRKTAKGISYHVCVVSLVEGKERSKSVWSGSSKEEANRVRRKVEKRMQEKRAGVDEPNPTLGKVLDDYLTHLDGRPSHRSVKSYLAQHFSDHELRMVRLADLTPSHVEAWREGMRRHPQTVIHGLGYLKAAINRARTTGAWKGDNVLDKVKFPRRPKSVVEILEPHEVERALPFFKKELDRALVGATYELIWRFGEAANLEKDRDVDIARRRITIRGAHGRDTKTGDTRTLPITDRALSWIELAMKASGESRYLFPSKSGARQAEDRKLARMLRHGLSQAGIVVAYDMKCRRRSCPHLREKGRQYVERAEVQAEQRCPSCRMLLWPSPIPRPVDFRSLRNAGATRMLLDGVPEAVVRDMLGHDSFEMLKRHYFQANPDLMRAAIEGADRRRPGPEPDRNRIRRVK